MYCITAVLGVNLSSPHCTGIPALSLVRDSPMHVSHCHCHARAAGVLLNTVLPDWLITFLLTALLLLLTYRTLKKSLSLHQASSQRSPLCLICSQRCCTVHRESARLAAVMCACTSCRSTPPRHGCITTYPVTISLGSSLSTAPADAHCMETFCGDWASQKCRPKNVQRSSPRPPAARHCRARSSRTHLQRITRREMCRRRGRRRSSHVAPLLACSARLRPARSGDAPAPLQVLPPRPPVLSG